MTIKGKPAIRADKENKGKKWPTTLLMSLLLNTNVMSVDMWNRYGGVVTINVKDIPMGAYGRGARQAPQGDHQTCGGEVRRQFCTIQSGCLCLRCYAYPRPCAGGLHRDLGSIGRGGLVFRAVLREGRWLNSSFSTIDGFILFSSPLFWLFALRFLGLLYQPSFQYTQPRINPRYTHLVVHVQRALVTVRRIERRRFWLLAFSSGKRVPVSGWLLRTLFLFTA